MLQLNGKCSLKEWKPISAEVYPVAEKTFVFFASGFRSGKEECISSSLSQKCGIATIYPGEKRKIRKLKENWKIEIKSDPYFLN